MPFTSAPSILLIVFLAAAWPPQPVRADQKPDKRFPLFAYLTGEPTATMIAYTPSQLDPRQSANQRNLTTSSIRADLKALRSSFDGLVLYGYHEACDIHGQVLLSCRCQLVTSLATRHVASPQPEIPCFTPTRR